MVELSRAVGGPVTGSYVVQDKVQEAELDPGMISEDELFAIEAWEPCLVCGAPDDGPGSMYCDGCDRSVHVFCAGFDDSPEVWYCETCLVDLENDVDLPGMASASRRQPRRRSATAPRRRRNNDAVWARVWQEVSRRLDLDLDFPFDDEAEPQRTEEQRREFQRWQRRFEVANRQGSSNRLRAVAAAQLTSEPAAPPQPESQEELRAWNAFDKARESQDAPEEVRRRKRKATESPASPREAEQAAQRELKRPRLRRPMGSSEQQLPESSNAAARRNGEEPTFLSSLLNEMENKPISAGSPTASDQLRGQFSPRNSSPMYSPASSEPGTPRAAVTPPPNRPLSPPLSSTILPATFSMGAIFSPFSPTDAEQDTNGTLDFHGRGRRRRANSSQHSDEDRSSSPSPSHTLSYSAKQEIQRMVKLALGTRYRDKEISKDQYTDINRDVSRKLYDLVKDASALTAHAEREKWQSVANEEVQKAITALSPDTGSDE